MRVQHRVTSGAVMRKDETYRELAVGVGEGQLSYLQERSGS